MGAWRVSLESLEDLNESISEVEIEKDPFDALTFRKPELHTGLHSIPNPLHAVSCRAWIVVEAASGDVLSCSSSVPGKKTEDDPLPLASLTKILTAELVLHLSKKAPDKPRQRSPFPGLDSVLTVHETAASASGTRAGLKAGDKLTVEQLLHALILPSGNDAALCLAEEFGKALRCQRLKAPAPTSVRAPKETERQLYVSEFVRAMNRRAKELGLQKSVFHEPSGFEASDPACRTSPNAAPCTDIVLLTEAALRHDAFVSVFGCQEYTVELEDGRRLHFDNKAGGLCGALQGWQGGKGGQSASAKYCACSLVEDDRRVYICVTLGSRKKELRSIDNRLIWWQALGKDIFLEPL